MTVLYALLVLAFAVLNVISLLGIISVAVVEGMEFARSAPSGPSTDCGGLPRNSAVPERADPNASTCCKLDGHFVTPRHSCASPVGIACNSTGACSRPTRIDLFRLRETVVRFTDASLIDFVNQGTIMYSQAQLYVEQIVSNNIQPSSGVRLKQLVIAGGIPMGLKAPGSERFVTLERLRSLPFSFELDGDSFTARMIAHHSGMQQQPSASTGFEIAGHVNGTIDLDYNIGIFSGTATAAFVVALEPSPLNTRVHAELDGVRLVERGGRHGIAVSGIAVDMSVDVPPAGLTLGITSCDSVGPINIPSFLGINVAEVFADICRSSLIQFTATEAFKLTIANELTARANEALKLEEPNLIADLHGYVQKVAFDLPGGQVWCPLIGGCTGSADRLLQSAESALAGVIAIWSVTGALWLLLIICIAWRRCGPSCPNMWYRPRGPPHNLTISPGPGALGCQRTGAQPQPGSTWLLRPIFLAPADKARGRPARSSAWLTERITSFAAFASTTIGCVHRDAHRSKSLPENDVRYGDEPRHDSNVRTKQIYTVQAVVAPSKLYRGCARLTTGGGEVD